MSVFFTLLPRCLFNSSVKEGGPLECELLREAGLKAESRPGFGDRSSSSLVQEACTSHHPSTTPFTTPVHHRRRTSHLQQHLRHIHTRLANRQR